MASNSLPRMAEQKVGPTPAPWSVLAPVGTWIQADGSPYGHGPMHVADVRGWGHLTGGGACGFDENRAVAIQNANARLIAAAPELLDALRLLVGLYDGVRDAIGASVSAKLAQADTAIARAEGTK